MIKSIVLLLGVASVAAVAYSQSSTTGSNSSDGDVAKAEPSQAAAKSPVDAKPEAADPEKIDWKKVDWRKRLTELQYHITREAGTERPFKNEYWNHFKEGSYKCVSCGLPLFESTSKFDAHCGWPSFDKAVAKNSVTEHKDYKLFAPRIEVRCRRCGAHLGHVFDDGPTKTGLRYCMNSAAMKFVPAKDAKGKSAVVADDYEAAKEESAEQTPAPANSETKKQ
jgi:methionine-R-sulfoxide reductase